MNIKEQSLELPLNGDSTNSIEWMLQHKQTAQRCYSELLKNAGLEAIALHKNGVLLHANERFYQLFQYNEQELKGTDFMPLLLTPVSIKALNGQCSNWIETECIKKDSTRFEAQLLSEVNQLGGSKIQAIVVRDISHLKHKYQLLLEAKTQAVRANQAKSLFLSRISHELKTPLNAIMGFAQLIQNESFLTDKTRAGVEQIVKGGEHILVLINELLEFSSIEADGVILKCEAVGVRSVIQESIMLLESTAEQHDISLSLTDNNHLDTNVYADHNKFKQIMLNLLSNAIKYNRKRGHVTICCEQRHDHVTFNVTDSGRGLCTNDIHKLFQSYNRLGVVDSNIEGTGIGLVITKQLVEKMGGEVGVHSEVGCGSNFWFTLPVYSCNESLNNGCQLVAI